MNQSIETPRAIRAAQTVARSFGVDAQEPVALAEGCAVRVHLKPAPLVARVSTLTALLRRPIDVWLKRELDVAAFLAQRGAPVVGPSDLLPPGPHWHDGLCVSFWSYVKPTQSEPPAQGDAARMLAALHQELRLYPGELPLLEPPLSDIPSGLIRIEERGAIDASDLSLLRRTFARLNERLTPDALGALQPLHGDAHVYNLIGTEQGWLWNDFEDTCLGPIAWDLASLTTEDAQLQMYPGAPDPESLTLFREVRRLHGVCWWYSLKEELASWEPFIAPMLEAIRSADK
jgi:hypothetical protein